MPILTRFFLLLLIAWGVSGCLIDEDSKPTADAGPDIVAAMDAGNAIALSGIASFDPNGDSLTYHWSIESLPAGSEASLSSFFGVEVVLTVDLAGKYKIGLTVDDGNSSSNKDILVIYYGVVPSSNADSDDEAHVGFTDTDATFSHPTGFNASCGECHLQSENHISTDKDCMECHNLFRWTPVIFNHENAMGDCVSCHDAYFAQGKSVDHLSTSDACENCHSTAGWRVATQVSHQEVLGYCFECHNGEIAAGKPQQHVESSNICDACHVTTSWINSGNGAIGTGGSVGGGSGGVAGNATIAEDVANHTEGVEVCVTCHDGVLATGQSANHIKTTSYCEACHSVKAWSPVVITDHNEVIGICEHCHNGVVATDKGVAHIATTDVCSACHATIAWLPTVTVDHNEVVGGTCETCHAPPASHIVVGVVASCKTCHSTAVWTPATSPLPLPVQNGRR